jgi:glycosyltransferase involved in cell wall biosynthesis
MTVSSSAAESISKTMGIPRNNIEVVYNSAGIAVHSNKLNTPVILTAGHIVAYKNPELWLEVARTVVKDRPGSTFVWLGDGELLETIRDKVRQMSLEDRIVLPGYIPYPSTWYDQASIYFQPSLRENHSIAVLEAMGHGLPCVVSDIGGLPESVLDGENGYVVPSDDVASFVTSIIKILDDQQLREKMGASGRQRIKELFMEEMQEQRILRLYQRLTNVTIV